MNLGYAHTLVAGLAIVVAGVCALFHAITSGDCQTIIIGSLGSLSGHAIGFAHGVQAGIKST